VVKENIFDRNFFYPGFNAAKIHKDINEIPSNAKVSASSSVLPHLAQRKSIYEFPNVDDAEYIAVFAHYDYFEIKEDEYDNALCQYIFSSDWNMIANDSPCLIFKKGKNIFSEKNNYDTITCDAEKLSSDKKNLLASNGEKVYDARSLDSTIVRNGKYSCKLDSSKNAYGMTLVDSTSFITGDFICVSIWRHSDSEDNGILALSCGKDFYVVSSDSVKRDNKGWEKLMIYAKIPNEHNNLRIYAWGNKKSPVWFDDLKIVRFRERIDK
jgi:hypothetical protein